MAKRILASIALVYAGMFFTSCESTLDYGYYMGELNDANVTEFFGLMDQAYNNEDLETYATLLGGDFHYLDKTRGTRISLYRYEYLDALQKLYDEAKYVGIYSVVSDINYNEFNDGARVKLQVEEKSVVSGTTKHYTSIYEAEIQIETGFLYLNKLERTHIQVIEE